MADELADQQGRSAARRRAVLRETAVDLLGGRRGHQAFWAGRLGGTLAESALCDADLAQRRVSRATQRRAQRRAQRGGRDGHLPALLSNGHLACDRRAAARRGIRGAARRLLWILRARYGLAAERLHADARGARARIPLQERSGMDRAGTRPRHAGDLGTALARIVALGTVSGF